VDNRRKFIQIRRSWCLFSKTVNGDEHSDWFEKLYDAKAAGLILYGRALGLRSGEAEDVLQETFLALMQKTQPPRELEHYCVRSFPESRVELPPFTLAPVHAGNWRRSTGLTPRPRKTRRSAMPCAGLRNCRWINAR